MMRYITALLLLYLSTHLTAQTDSFAIKRCVAYPDVYKGQIVYRVAEKMPVFQNGPADFLKYITKNMVYSENQESVGLRTRFYVTFVIDTLGKTQDVCCITKQAHYTPEEQQIIELVQKSPPWAPAFIEDKKVCVRLLYPIIIHLK